LIHKDLLFWSPKIYPSCSQDSSSHVFPIFSIHESLPKRNQPSPKSPLFWFSKIRILTLWISRKDPQPLPSKFTKKFLLYISWYSPTNGLKNGYKVFKSRANRSMIFLDCVSIPCLVQIVAASRQKRVMIFDESATPNFSNINKSCHNFSKNSNTQFWVTSQHFH
jgi:hypothetical protein